MAKIFCVIVLLMNGLIFVSSQEPGSEFKRKLNGTLNPDCPTPICNEKTGITLLHVEANSDHDSIHYIWDFSKSKKPSVLVALTQLNTTLNINWTNYMTGSENTISFSAKADYVFVVVLNKIWEFNDYDDHALLSHISRLNVSDVFPYETEHIAWTRESYSLKEERVELKMSGKNKVILGDGNLLITLKEFANKQHGVDFPHLLHSSNSTQIDIVLDNMKILPGFNNPRFAVEVLLFTSELKDENTTFFLNRRKSIDDEHTPGIFEIYDVMSPKSINNEGGAYIQFRPVSYTHPERDVTTSTETHLDPLTAVDAEKELQNTLAWSLYGKDVRNYLVQGLNVTFGLTGDGFYKKTNYTTWTFVMGYGSPPVEQLSMLIIIVACIGLGVPLGLLFIGACYICAKRVRRNSSSMNL